MEKMMTKQNKQTVTIILMLAVIVVSYYFFSQKKQPEDLIAIVGNQKIFIQDVEKEMKRRGGRHQQSLDKNLLLEEMILRAAMIDQAIKTGIDQQPDFIRTYQNLLVGQYKKKYLKPLIDGVDLTADEIQSYYSSHIEKYTQPAKARLALIFMRIHSKMSDERKNKIKTRMFEARKKASQISNVRGFGPVAVQYSEDQVTRYKGGDIGWVYENQAYRWDQKVLSAGFALEKINEISDIITTDDGLYLVKLIDRRPSKVRPFEKVKAKIRHKQILDQRKQVESNFEKTVREKTPVTIYQDALDKVVVTKADKDNSKLPVPMINQ